MQMDKCLASLINLVSQNQNLISEIGQQIFAAFHKSALLIFLQIVPFLQLFPKDTEKIKYKYIMHFVSEL